MARHLRQAHEALIRVENWLRTPNERELRASDREIVHGISFELTPGKAVGIVGREVVGEKQFGTPATKRRGE